MKRYLMASVLLLFFLCASWSSEVSGPQRELSIEDSTGQNALLESIPRRITFAGKASNIVADALYMFPEAPERIVGVGNTNQRNGHFIEVLDKNYNDKTYLEHSVGPEQIAVTEPDLIILKNFHKKTLGESLSPLGIPVLYLDLESPAAYERDFRMLGRIFGNSDRAEELIRYYREAEEYVTHKTSSLTDRPDILFIYHSTRDGITAFNIPPESWIQTSMVKMAGGEPLWAGSNPGGGWAKISFEQIAAWNPDQIYIAAYRNDIGDVMESLEKSEEWSELDALKKGNLHAFPVDFYSWDQPDSRWILGLRWLAKKMHPELFQDLDIEEMTRSFYKDLYFLTDEQIDREIMSRLGW